VSVQFGWWSFAGQPLDPGHLAAVDEQLLPYGPDGGFMHSEPDVSIAYRPFHTTWESRRETQPHVARSGHAIVWDGRLDNRDELVSQLPRVAAESPDVLIVSASYERWGPGSFAKLIGDWALSIWNPRERELILAKDFVGTRPLYYRRDRDQVVWSSLLEAILTVTGPVTLDEEYIAGCIAHFPAHALTPYREVHSVPPAAFVLLRKEGTVVQEYWNFDPVGRIRYSTDEDYEAHFRTVVSEAVRRRLRSDKPVLAELSGGMDSSSIVCVADLIIAQGTADCPRLDTVSYYSDSEPNWNERPYFAAVERKRGRQGWHIDTGSEETPFFGWETHPRAVAPGAFHYETRISREFADCLRSQDNRVLLSGTGGDEVLGGVPNPIPLLADLLVGAKFGALANHLDRWARTQRDTVFNLFLETIRAFLPGAIFGASQCCLPPAWMRSDFVKRNRQAFAGYRTRLTMTGVRPSLQDNLNTLDALRRQFACSTLDPACERRYPYLDRTLLSFLYAIPPDQLLRPGQRRSLMRRALPGIVPDEILQRKRKAFVSRAPFLSVSRQWAGLIEMSESMLCSALGIIDPPTFKAVLERARLGQNIPMVPLMRTLGIERWLRNLQQWDCLPGDFGCHTGGGSSKHRRSPSTALSRPDYMGTLP
jgi:asparagine synthase (glutamine-hydrolysing)